MVSLTIPSRQRQEDMPWYYQQVKQIALLHMIFIQKGHLALTFLQVMFKVLDALFFFVFVPSPQLSLWLFVIRLLLFSPPHFHILLSYPPHSHLRHLRHLPYPPHPRLPSYPPHLLISSHPLSHPHPHKLILIHNKLTPQSRHLRQRSKTQRYIRFLVYHISKHTWRKLHCSQHNQSSQRGQKPRL